MPPRADTVTSYQRDSVPESDSIGEVTDEFTPYHDGADGSYIDAESLIGTNGSDIVFSSDPDALQDMLTQSSTEALRHLKRYQSWSRSQGNKGAELKRAYLEANERTVRLFQSLTALTDGTAAR